MNYTPHRAGFDVWLRYCDFRRHIQGMLAQLLHDEFGMRSETKTCVSRAQSGLQVTETSISLVAYTVTAGLFKPGSNIEETHNGCISVSLRCA